MQCAAGFGFGPLTHSPKQLTTCKFFLHHKNHISWFALATVTTNRDGLDHKSELWWFSPNTTLNFLLRSMSNDEFRARTNLPPLFFAFRLEGELEVVNFGDQLLLIPCFHNCKWQRRLMNGFSVFALAEDYQDLGTISNNGRRLIPQ